MADRLAPPGPGIVVLIYHRVGRRSALEVDLPTAIFREQMQFLASTGRVVDLDTAIDALTGAGEPSTTPADAVVITFDDGTADFADVAAPILHEFSLPSTLYVATQFVDEGLPFPGDGVPLSWAALRDVHAGGLLTVGAHTHSHLLLDRLAPDAVEPELDRADDLIGEHLSVRPAHFAYPKAVAGSSRAEAAVRRRYRSAALAGTRPNRRGTADPHRLARSPIQTSDGMTYFRAKVAGGMRFEDSLRVTANRWRYRGSTG
jgi:peptidoglycan/xylan/chitin deacetylase (PgdA/CDA1 family)